MLMKFPRSSGLVATIRSDRDHLDAKCPGLARQKWSSPFNDFGAAGGNFCETRLQQVWKYAQLFAMAGMNGSQAKNTAVTIFVVDDEPMLLEMAVMILEPLKFNVRTFRDPQ